MTESAKQLAMTTEELAVKIYRAQRDELHQLSLDMSNGRPGSAIMAFYDFQRQDKAEAEAQINAYLDTMQERIYEARRILNSLMEATELGTDRASERQAEAVIRAHFEGQN